MYYMVAYQNPLWYIKAETPLLTLLGQFQIINLKIHS